MLHDYLISLIRTVVPVGIGAALAWLAAHLGIVIDDGSSAGLTVAVVAVAIAAYYALVRALEGRWSWLGVLLGKPAAPVYDLPPGESDSTAYYYPDGTLKQIRSTTTWPERPSR